MDGLRQLFLLIPLVDILFTCPRNPASPYRRPIIFTLPQKQKDHLALPASHHDSGGKMNAHDVANGWQRDRRMISSTSLPLTDVPSLLTVKQMNQCLPSSCCFLFFSFPPESAGNLADIGNHFQRSDLKILYKQHYDDDVKE